MLYYREDGKQVMHERNGLAGFQWLLSESWATRTNEVRTLKLNTTLQIK